MKRLIVEYPGLFVTRESFGSGKGPNQLPFLPSDRMVTTLITLYDII
jgi:hypothetical protein